MFCVLIFSAVRLDWCACTASSPNLFRSPCLCRSVLNKTVKCLLLIMRCLRLEWRLHVNLPLFIIGAAQKVRDCKCSEFAGSDIWGFISLWIVEAIVVKLHILFLIISLVCLEEAVVIILLEIRALLMKLDLLVFIIREYLRPIIDNLIQIFLFKWLNTVAYLLLSLSLYPVAFPWLEIIKMLPLWGLNELSIRATAGTSIWVDLDRAMHDHLINHIIILWFYVPWLSPFCIIYDPLRGALQVWWCQPFCWYRLQPFWCFFCPIQVRILLFLFLFKVFLIFFQRVIIVLDFMDLYASTKEGKEVNNLFNRFEVNPEQNGQVSVCPDCEEIQI